MSWYKDNRKFIANRIVTFARRPNAATLALARSVVSIGNVSRSQWCRYWRTKRNNPRMPELPWAEYQRELDAIEDWKQLLTIAP